LLLLCCSLCRLPKLDNLDVTVEGDTLPAALMSMALYRMRTQLLQLRFLDLKVQQSWRSANHVWRELGNMTQLTGLLLHSGNEEVSAEGATPAASCCAGPDEHSTA
jgi:hypothetical protein